MYCCNICLQIHCWINLQLQSTNNNWLPQLGSTCMLAHADFYSIRQACCTVAFMHPLSPLSWKILGMLISDCKDQFLFGWSRTPAVTQYFKCNISPVHGIHQAYNTIVLYAWQSLWQAKHCIEVLSDCWRARLSKEESLQLLCPHCYNYCVKNVTNLIP